MNYKNNKNNLSKKYINNFRNEIFLHLLIFPTIIYFIVFHYIPIYGIQIAFKEFSFGKGILGSPWVGLSHFKEFFSSIYFTRLIRNTIILSVYGIIFGFPAPIVFALLLNEIKNKSYKKFVQTASYFPHFLSEVIVVGIMMLLLSPESGLINNIRAVFGYERIAFMQSSKYFRLLYVASDIWQGFGWGSIVYLSALTNISPTLYESAVIDGANRWQQVKYITIPGIMNTIIIMFILRVGGIMSVGAGKIILMYNPAIYDVSDVISTYVYRKSLMGGEYSFGTAVGLFNNIINFTLVWLTNKISRKFADISLW